MIIEFSFKNKSKFIYIIAQTIFGMVLVKLNFSKNLKNEGAIVLFNLITECTLTFSFILYYIEKKRSKRNKNKKMKNLEILSLDLNKVAIILKKKGFLFLSKSIKMEIYIYVYFYFIC
jgi:hypothetical protein